MPLLAHDRLLCPSCGWEVTDLLCAHPQGFAGAVAVALDAGLVCCGHKPTLEETKVWARIVYARYGKLRQPMPATHDLTKLQRSVLSTLEFSASRTAQWMGVRSDVLWRLEERGLVARNSHTETRWRITGAGREALRNAR